MSQQNMPARNPSNFIQGYDAWKTKMKDLSPSGFRIAINFKMKDGAQYYEDTYAPEWTKFYEENELENFDPITQIATTRDICARWSDVPRPSHISPEHRRAAEGVMKMAIKYGLQFGIISSVLVGGKRTMLSAARPDREFTDAEIGTIKDHFEIIIRQIGHRPHNLTGTELEVLKLRLSGQNGTAIAKTRGTSPQAAIKILKSIRKKLNADSLDDLRAAAELHGLLK